MRSLSALLVLFLAQSLASLADTRLYLEGFSIVNGETKEVSLILDNDKDATVFQATLTLPSGLTYKENSVQKTSRVQKRGATVQASYKNNELTIVEVDGTIAAGSGAVVTFQVTADNTMAIRDYEIKLTDIVVSDANAEQLNAEDENTATVTVRGMENFSFAAPESIELAVGQEYQVDVTLSNDGLTDLVAIQGKLYLPDGLKIVPGEDGKFIYTDRTPEPLEFTFKEFEGYTSFVLSSSNNTLITGTSGVLFSFKVKADSTLPETSEIKLTDLRIARKTGISGTFDEDVTISVTNNSVIFDAYKAEQAEAVEALREEGDSEAAQDIVNDAVEAIEGLAYDIEKSLDENKAAVDEIVAPVAEALDAQRAADAAAAQLAADKAAFEAYVAEQAAAVEAMAEEGDSEASQAIIAAAVEAIEALEYDEEKTLDENKAAVDELVAPVEEALEAQREADAIIPGDVNGDGKINTVDASYILMYLVGNTPEDFVEKAADVDGDGKINTLDATAILKKLVE